MVSEKVVTETGEQLRDYELVLILRPELAEQDFEAALERVSRLITARGGIIDDTERWGKRRLAYPIKHSGEGNYVLMKFKLKPTLGKELETSLRITDEVLRHLLVRLDS
jgi:small subunit ribosomal protein S6